MGEENVEGPQKRGDHKPWWKLFMPSCNFGNTINLINFQQYTFELFSTHARPSIAKKEILNSNYDSIKFQENFGARE